MHNYIGFIVCALFLVPCVVFFFLWADAKSKPMRIIGIVLFFASLACFGASSYVINSYLRDAELRGAYFYHGPEGDFLVSNAEYSQAGGIDEFYSDRIISTNLATQAQTRVVSFSGLNLLAHSGSVGWYMHGDDDLQARDSVTLKLLAEEKELLAKNPTLSGGISNDTFHMLDDGRFVVRGENGKYYALDAKTFTATEVAEQIALKGTELHAHLGMNPGTKFADSYAKLDTGMELTISGGRLNTGSGPTLKPLSALIFVSPDILFDATTDKPLLIDPNTVVIVSQSRVSDAEQHLLTAISLSDGKTLWQTDLFDPATEESADVEASVVNGTLYFVTNRWVYAVETKTGSVLRSLHF